MRFRPNRRASTDHAPGPISDNAAPIVPTMMWMDARLEGTRMRNASERPSNKPATGVQSPMINSAEAAAASNWKDVDGCVVALGLTMNCASGIAASARNSNSPAPGLPSGNVEKSRCTRCPVFRLAACSKTRNPGKRMSGPPLSRRLQLDDSALNRDSDRVGPVIRAKFCKDILDVALDRFFRDRQLCGDFFIRIAVRDEAKDLDLALG